ncbi:MAG TPA: hypothetical protein VHF47_04440 [Acidimicrobiales bacterium]|nr:hypothetical protein [Acidimicrobiales bacterium]
MSGVVVLGADAEAVADRVAALRTEGVRAAGFVGGPDEGPAAEAMAAELFGPDGTVFFADPAP